jgi:hypothetical protein
MQEKIVELCNYLHLELEPLMLKSFQRQVIEDLRAH